MGILLGVFICVTFLLGFEYGRRAASKKYEDEIKYLVKETNEKYVSEMSEKHSEFYNLVKFIKKLTDDKDKK